MRNVENHLMIIFYFTLIGAAMAISVLPKAWAFDSVPPTPRIKDNGDIRLSDDVKVGRLQGSKYIATPDRLQIQGEGSTGDASDLSLKENGGAAVSASDAVGFAMRPEAYRVAPRVGFDGSADDTNAVVRADNAAVASGAVLEISRPTRIASNVVLNAPVRIRYGRLIADGATITFKAGATALGEDAFECRNTCGVSFGGSSLSAPPLKRAFKLTGAGTKSISGLAETRIEWFAEHNRGTWAVPPIVESRALIQMAVDATADNGTVRAGTGHWLIDGSQPIIFGRGQGFEGAGRLKTVFNWTGATTNGFYSKNAETSFTTLRGFLFRPGVAGTIPTSGIAVLIENPLTTVRDFYVEDPFEGLVHNNTTQCIASEFYVNGAARAGRRITNSNDIYTYGYIIQALYDWFTISPTSGTFKNGEAVTLSTGQVGQITSVYGGNRYRITITQNRKRPTVGATITGGTSGAIGTVSAFQTGHALGGERWEGNNEAVTTDKFDVLGGEYSFTVAGRPTAYLRSGSAFNRVGAGYFDTSYSGSLINGLYATEFQGTWFASAGNGGSAGVSFINSKKIRGFGVQVVNNADAGLTWDGTNDDMEFHGTIAEGNTLLSGSADIAVGINAKNWKLIGGSAGGPGANSTKDPVALSVGRGAFGLVMGLSFNTQGATKLIDGSGGNVRFTGNLPTFTPGLNSADAEIKSFAALIAGGDSKYIGPAGSGGLNENVWIAGRAGVITKVAIQVNVAPGSGNTFSYQVVRFRAGSSSVFEVGAITDTATSLATSIAVEILPDDRYQISLVGSAGSNLASHSGYVQVEP